MERLPNVPWPGPAAESEFPGVIQGRDEALTQGGRGRRKMGDPSGDTKAPPPTGRFPKGEGRGASTHTAEGSEEGVHISLCRPPSLSALVHCRLYSRGGRRPRWGGREGRDGRSRGRPILGYWQAPTALEGPLT